MPQPTPLSGGTEPRAIDLFTDREQPQKLFAEARADLAPDQYRILVFYGVGGQGKTLLCEKLRANLTAEQPGHPLWGHLDLHPVSHHDPAQGLLQLRKSLGQSGRSKFPAFDYAIATYWEKAYPTENIEVALQGIIGQHEDVWSTVAENAPGWVGEAVDSGVMSLVVKGVKHLWKQRAKENAEKAFPVLYGLQLREQWEILQDLPFYLGLDLRAYRQGKDAPPPVIFIDTYEALWADKNIKTGLGTGETDAWLRRLVAESPGVLFVIFGRDKLTWDQRFPRDWDGYLDQQHLLGGLSDADADAFLQLIPVREEAVRRIMIEGAKGKDAALIKEQMPGSAPTDERGALPFYLDIEAKTYRRILALGRNPTPQDFGGTYTEIIDRFLRYSSTVERETLKLLSVPRFFDEELFAALVQHFGTHYPLTAYAEFTAYSFIEKGNDGSYRLHALMDDHLDAELDERQSSALKQFLFDWYDARCQPASPKDITAAHEVALREAVYHQEVHDAQAALDWFWARWLMFNDAARYKTIEPLIRWALSLAEARLGADHPETAIAINNLATLLKATNRLAEAEPLLRRALAIAEASYGPDHLAVAIALNNLAVLLLATNRLTEAEPLMRRALAIDEASYGPEHPAVATALNNFASLLQATNRLAEAEPLIRRAWAIDEASYGPEHPEVAIDLNNLAQLLQDTNRLAEAEPLMHRALAIDDASYGPEHPNVARDLNNLARLLADTNRMGKAEPLMRRVVEIFEKSYGPEHPHVAIALSNLAQLLHATHRLEEAEPLMRRALAKMTEAMLL